MSTNAVTNRSLGLLGTSLEVTTYAQCIQRCQELTRRQGTHAIDFSNTQVLTMRRHEQNFRNITSGFDHFIPDGMPLIWCLNLQGAGLRDRVYGPTFMRHCILNSPRPFSHYFLGGSPECLSKLQLTLREQQSNLFIAGSRDGYFKPEDEAGICEEINRLSPDFIWVGLGTPKQQDWIFRNKPRIRRGLFLAVGFAFDVNAGTKSDAPLWMQKRGLTWLYRLWSEPRRLGPRYVRYNSLFLSYLIVDGLRGRLFSRTLPGKNHDNPHVEPSDR